MRCHKTLWIVLLTSAAWAAQGLRHGTNQVTKALGVEILAGLLGGAVPEESVWGQLTRLGEPPKPPPSNSKQYFQNATLSGCNI